MRRPARLLALAPLLLALAACIQLPPELEHELDCPVAGAPDHFAVEAAGPCTSHVH